MLEIRITAPEIYEAISSLAKAISHATTIPNGMTNGAMPTNTICAAVEESTHTPVAVAPQTPTVPQATPATPITPTAPVAPTVPTAAPKYTLDMIANAGTALIDAGRMGDLTALLAKYGVEALTALNPAQYGTFANDLRALGASI